MLTKPVLFLIALTALALAPRDLHANTLTVAVIDTGIDHILPNLCKQGHKSFITQTNPKNPFKSVPGNPLEDYNGHGTHIAGIINRNAGVADYCLVSIQFYSKSNTAQQNIKALQKALRYAININVGVINLSGGGPEENTDEKALIKEALDKGIKVIVAAGNEHDDLDKKCNYFPACYDPRIIAVGNLQITADYRSLPEDLVFMAMVSGVSQKIGTVDTDRSPSSNYGNYVKEWEIGTNVKSDLPGGNTGYMSGTSQATAVATGKYLRKKLKHEN